MPPALANCALPVRRVVAPASAVPLVQHSTVLEQQVHWPQPALPLPSEALLDQALGQLGLAEPSAALLEELGQLGLAEPSAPLLEIQEHSAALVVELCTAVSTTQGALPTQKVAHPPTWQSQIWLWQDQPLSHSCKKTCSGQSMLAHQNIKTYMQQCTAFAHKWPSSHLVCFEVHCVLHTYHG